MRTRTANKVRKRDETTIAAGTQRPCIKHGIFKINDDDTNHNGLPLHTTTPPAVILTNLVFAFVLEWDGSFLTGTVNRIGDGTYGAEGTLNAVVEERAAPSTVKKRKVGDMALTLC